MRKPAQSLIDRFGNISGCGAEPKGTFAMDDSGRVRSLIGVPGFGTRVRKFNSPRGGINKTFVLLHIHVLRGVHVADT